MTVREWFRKLRASAWEVGGVPQITLYPRGTTEPLGVPMNLLDLNDYMLLIELICPQPVQFNEVLFPLDPPHVRFWAEEAWKRRPF